MINDFDDFCLWMYILVDDIWQQIAPLFKRPGPEPGCSDSELITMALVGDAGAGMSKLKCSASGRSIVTFFRLFPHKVVSIGDDGT